MQEKEKLIKESMALSLADKKKLLNYLSILSSQCNQEPASLARHSGR